MPKLKHCGTGRVVDVNETTATRYLSLGWVEADGDSESTDTEAPSMKWTVAELEKFAADHNIDLSEAKTKPEKLAAIEDAEVEADGDSESDDSDAATVPDTESVEGEAADAS